MKIYEVQARTSRLSEDLLNIWECSVRATHMFLSDAEVNRIKEYVPQALGKVEHLIIAERENGTPVAFMGTENSRLEMLFLSPLERGKGLGKQLLRYGMANYGIREVYEHMGFRTYKRTDCDEEGNPYPLLYMKSAE